MENPNQCTLAGSNPNGNGGKFVLWMFIATLAGLLVFSLTNATLLKRHEIKFEQIHKKPLPSFIEVGKTFRTEGAILVQLFVPSKNTKITLLIPNNKATITPQQPFSLFELTKEFQATKDLMQVESKGIDPLFIKYLSALFAFKRGALDETKIGAQEKSIEFFRLKDTQYYATGIFEYQGEPTLITAFCPSSRIEYDLFDSVLKEIL